MHSQLIRAMQLLAENSHIYIYIYNILATRSCINSPLTGVPRKNETLRMRLPTATSINVAGRQAGRQADTLLCKTKLRRRREKGTCARCNFQHTPAAEYSLNCRRIRSRTFILNFRRNKATAWKKETKRDGEMVGRWWISPSTTRPRTRTTSGRGEVPRGGEKRVSLPVIPTIPGQNIPATLCALRAGHWKLEGINFGCVT